MKKPSLRVRFSDLLRVTLDEGCGNVGFIGLSPDGSEYHVVVPVDLQIARGVKACNRPADGTPFGGYKGWEYFQCAAYNASGKPEVDRTTRLSQAEENGRRLMAWAAGLGIRLDVEKAAQLTGALGLG